MCGLVTDLCTAVHNYPTMEFDYSHPQTDVRFGRGRRDEVGEAVARHGDEALVVTTRSAMQEAGFLDDVLTSIGTEDVSATVYDDVQPNPTVEDVIETVEAVENEEVDVVVGLGGGSPTDTAKAAALALAEFEGTPSPEGLWEFCLGERPLVDALPLVAVPSTSGTGSHVDPWAVVTDEDAPGKVGFGGDPLVPASAVVDPDIPGEMPPELTARTGFDALCHLTEAYVARGADGLTDAYAERGMGLVVENLPDAVEGKKDAREKMAVADTLAGFCEATSGVIATHALAHAISAYEPDVPHGIALASVAGEVARHNAKNGDDETKKRYGEVAEILGFPVADHKLDSSFAGEAYDDFVTEIGHGLDVSLGELVQKEPETLAQNAAEYMSGAIGNNPVELEKDDLVGILERS